MVAVLVAWQYTVQQYREAVRQITNRANSAYSYAMLAVSNTREHTAAAAQYEKQALDTAAIAVRDARLAQSIKLIDFFEEARGAWTAIGRVADAAAETSQKAREAVNDARSVVESEPPGTRDGILAKALYKRSTAALEAADGAEKAARFAQATVDDFKDAKAQFSDVRTREVSNAERTVAISGSLANSTANTSVRAFTVTEEAEKVKKLADQASAAAAEGDMKSANSLAKEAEDAAKKAAEAEKKVALAREEARKLLVKLQLGK
jgi:hypothetical protein